MRRKSSITSASWRGGRRRRPTASGGNLQKYILGRDILRQPRLLAAAHPTWGVDGRGGKPPRADRTARCGRRVPSSRRTSRALAISDRIAAISGGRLSPSIPAEGAARERIGEWTSCSATSPAAQGTMRLRLEPRTEIARWLDSPRRCLRRFSYHCGVILFAAIGYDPARGMETSSSPIDSVYGLSELASESHAAPAVRARPRGGLPRQCLEHRCGGPAHHWRDLRRRSGTRLPRQRAVLAAAGDDRGRCRGRCAWAAIRPFSARFNTN